MIEKSKLRVGVKGLTAVLDGDLYAAVKPDDSFWNSDGTALEITLQKVTSSLGYCTSLSCHSAIPTWQNSVADLVLRNVCMPLIFYLTCCSMSEHHNVLSVCIEQYG